MPAQDHRADVVDVEEQGAPYAAGLEPTGLRSLLAEEESGLLSAIFAASPDGAAYISQSFTVRTANEAFARQMRIPLERIVGHAVEEAVPGWTEQVGALYHQVQKSGKSFKAEAYPFEFKAQPGRGLTHWDVAISPVYGRGRVFYGYLLLLRDATERVRAAAEQARLLHEMERQRVLVQAVIDNAPAAIAVLRAPDMVFEIVNPAAMTLLAGVSPIGRRVAEVSPVSAPRALPILERVLRTGEPYHVADMPNPVRRTPEGPLEEAYLSFSLVPLRTPEGQAGAILAMGVETTEYVRARHRIEELAAEAQRRAAEMDATLAAFPEGLVIVDPAGRITRFNAVAHEILGIAAEDRLRSIASRLALLRAEKPDGTPLQPEEAAGTRALLGETVRETVWILHRPGGGTFWVANSAAPIRASDGRLLGAVIALTDITALHELQEQTRHLLEAERRAREEAEAAVRARDEFLSAAAHELKTPVTNLRGYAQLTARQLGREAVDPQRIRHAMQVIDRQSERLSRLVAQLLDISAMQAGRLELERHPTDLVTLVRRVVARAEAASPGLTFHVQAPPSSMALVDAARLEQVLANLLDNAVKFSPKGAPVDVAVWAADAATVHIAVRDYGPGIPPERRARLFSRFYQAEPRPFAGLGLGLYYAREIAERHGGRIDAEFPPEGGTRIVITLPIQRSA